MKTVRLINICPGLETLTQNQQEYLRAADVSVCDEGDGILLFQWDDTVYNEKIDIKAVRIARTIEEMFALESHTLDPIVKTIMSMSTIAAYSASSPLSGQEVPDFRRMNVVKNWKSVRKNLGVKQAFEALRSGNSVFGLPVAIRHGQRIITRDTNIKDVRCSSAEVISDKWEIIVPDVDAESRLSGIRNLIKESDLSNVVHGVKKSNIDYMDVSQLWKVVSSYVERKPDEEKILLMKLIINHNY